MTKLENARKTDNEISVEVNKLKQNLVTLFESNKVISAQLEDEGIRHLRNTMNGLVKALTQNSVNYESLKVYEAEMNNAFINLQNYLNHNNVLGEGYAGFIKDLEDWNSEFSDFIYKAELSAVLNSDKKYNQPKDFSDIFKGTIEAFRQHFYRHIIFLFRNSETKDEDRKAAIMSEFSDKLDAFVESFKLQDGERNILIDFEREFKILRQSVRNIFFNLDYYDKKYILKPEFSDKGVKKILADLETLPEFLLKAASTYHLYS